MNDFAIRAEGLGKEYRIGQVERYKALRDVITEALYAPVRALRRGEQEREGSKGARIWALDDVSFEVARGEVVGVVGANGAGKSTLLKILSRITEPTRGYATVAGRVGSLLEVGTGFHPELTGRDNVYLNGIILGMRKREIERKFSEIVEFAGVERFIDTPVKRYSSGMQVRLAFSVAAHLQPEVLLVDEVLAVGDAEFQRKSLGRMEDVTREGRTVLFVSHNLTAIRTLCPRTILIEAGKVGMDGPTDAVLSRYLSALVGEGEESRIRGRELDEKANSYCWLDQPVLHGREVAITDTRGTPRGAFHSDEEIVISISYDVLQPTTNLQVFVELQTQEGETIMRSELTDDASADLRYLAEPGSYTATCSIPANTFGERRFYLTPWLVSQDTHHISYPRALHFDVSFMGYNGNLSPHSKGAYLRPQLAWEVAGPSTET
jgi:lipopolysaccharide transport system ATP-binding protein